MSQTWLSLLPRYSILWNVVLIALSTYLIVLFSVNLVPHVSVGGLGFLLLRRVTFTSKRSTVKIGRISLQINVSGKSDRPFRRFNIVIANVEIHQAAREERNPEPALKHSMGEVPTNIQIKLPRLVSELLFKRRWMNQFTVHLHQCSITHEDIHKHIAFHFDYLRLESTYISAKSLHEISLSLLNAYLEDKSSFIELQTTRIVHNLELALTSNLSVMCSTHKGSGMIVDVSDIDFRVVLGDCYIPNIPRIKKQMEKAPSSNATRLEKQVGSKYFNPETFVRVLLLISSVSLKFNQTTIDYNDLVVKWNTFSVALDSHRSYKLQNFFKLSSFINNLVVTHLELRCLEIPSVAYLFEVELTDLYRALKSDLPENFWVDITLSINITNPTFNFYFDQLQYISGSKKRKKPASSGDSAPAAPGQIRKFLSMLDKVRKISLSITVIDTTFMLHLPPLHHTGYLRIDRNNIVSKASIAIVSFKTLTKSLQRMVRRQCSNLSKPLTLKGRLRLKKFMLEIEGNVATALSVSVLVGYCVDYDSAAIKLRSHDLVLRSVNTMIFHVVRKIKENRIQHLNTACACLPDLPLDPHAAPTQEEVKEVFRDIFDMMPKVILKASLEFELIQFIQICNDNLPSFKYVDEATGEEVDLAEFKRGVSVALNDLSVNFSRTAQEFNVDLRLIQANTLSTFPQEYVQGFDEVSHVPAQDWSMDDLSSLNSSALDNLGLTENVDKVKKVLTIRDLLIHNPDKLRDKLLLTIPEFDARLDIFFFWCIFYTVTMVKIVAPTVKEEYSSAQVRQYKRNSLKLNLDVKILSLTVVSRLPNDVDVLLELDLAFLCNVFARPSCQAKYTRLYVVHPATRLWVRLVTILDTYVNLENLSHTTLTLNTASVHFNIPFQFLVYTVIDNVITLVKSIVQMKLNFKALAANQDEFKTIQPAAKKAVILPKVRWKSRTFGITLENDAFEAELSMIFQLGKMEQVDRIKKWAHFRKKEEEIRLRISVSLSEEKVAEDRFAGKPTKSKFLSSLKKADSELCAIADHIVQTFKKDSKRLKVMNSKEVLIKESAKSVALSTPDHGSRVSGSIGISSRDTSSQDSSKFGGTGSTSQVSSHSDSHVKNSSSSAQDENPSTRKSKKSPRDLSLTEEEAEEMINNAKRLLEIDLGLSWFHKFSMFKKSQKRVWRDRVHTMFDDDTISEAVRGKFDIQDYAQGHPQLTGLFKNFDLTLDKPNIPDVDEFLRIYGKGQPKLIYSILIPMYVHLRSSAVFFSIKDYYLPLLSFPSDADPEKHVFDFKGNLVINEKLVTRREEMRHIYVPFSPALRSAKTKDLFYSVHVPRTLTPVKVMFDLKCHIATERACILTWCKSYSPALLSIMSSFDNFTKPQIDDSPLGWWDKLSLIAHGKLRFDIDNEFCLHIKSSTSPYAMTGKDAGFVFCWKTGVSLKVNETGDSTEVLTLDSHDFIFGIPNYSSIEKEAWSLNHMELQYLIYDSHVESHKFLKKVMVFSSDEKVRWKLGFMFERNADSSVQELSSNVERTNKFKPHYDVVVTGPSYEWHPDSYQDFRSDYLHMAILVSSKSSKGNCFNAAYFTPMGFHYWFHWWHTILNTISLPIREGKLFATKEKESHVSMGPHLFTFKYQLDLAPLTISHTYISFDPSDPERRTVATGIKGKCERCIIDLHQRKEFVRYVNEKLGIDRRIRKLKLFLGEIDITDADIRLLNAHFLDKSLRGEIYSFFIGKTNEFIDVETFQRERMNSQRITNQNDWVRGISVTNDDFSWMDQEDFIEVEEVDVLSADPDVRITPFFFTPKFTYFREFSLEVPEGRYPFGREDSHVCLIGAQSPEEVQASLLKRRAEALRQELKENDEAAKQLEQLNNPVFIEDYERLKVEIVDGQKKLVRVTDLYEDVASGTSAEPSIADVGIDVPQIREPDQAIHRMNTRASSAATMHSVEEARRVTSEKSSLSDFHNRFLLHNLQLRWDNETKDAFNRYSAFREISKLSGFAMTYQAMTLVDSFVKQLESSTGGGTSDRASVNNARQFSCCGEVIQDFEEYLENLDDDIEQEIENEYLIKLICPQIQLSSEIDPDHCVLMTSSDVEMRVVNVNQSGASEIVRDGDDLVAKIETRNGVRFNDSNFFAFKRANFPNRSVLPYGLKVEKYTWPPWLEAEAFDLDLDWLRDNLVVERTAMAVTVKKPNLLSMEAQNRNDSGEISVHMAKVVVSATTEQYSAIYYIVTNLILLEKEGSNAFDEQIKNLIAVSDISDFVGLTQKIQTLQANIRICQRVLQMMDQRITSLSQAELWNKSHVQIELERMQMELTIVIHSLKLVGARDQNVRRAARNWNILADQIIWHILENDREPIVDFAIGKSHFSRIDATDGSNSNSVEILMLQGFNLRPKAPYPEIIKPFGSVLDTDTSPVIKMLWKMLAPVGGIPVMSNAELKLRPAHFQLDYYTLKKLMAYLFPKDNSSDKDGDLLDTFDSELIDQSDNTSVTMSTAKKLTNPFRSRSAKQKNRSGRDLPSSSFSYANGRDTISLGTSGSSDIHSGGPTLGLTPRTKNGASTRSKNNGSLEAGELKARSGEYFVIGEFKVHSATICVSFRAPKHLHIIDVHNLTLSVPTIHFKDKTWTSEDLTRHLKKSLIRVIVSHTGKIIGNKFKLRKKETVNRPLHQIQDYSKYVTLEDMQDEKKDA